MARLTLKSYKRRRVVMGGALFMAIALISTGFAAWVVSSQSEKEGTGNVTAGIINDKSIEITVNNADNLGTFSFNPKADDNTGRVRFDKNDAEGAENLTVNLTGTLTNPDFLGELTVKLVELNNQGEIIENVAETKIQKAVDAKFIEAPDCFYNEVPLYKFTEQYTADKVDINGGSPVPAYTSDGTTGAFDYNIHFHWGETFGKMNPGLYYDEDDTGKNVSNAELVENLSNLRRYIYGLADDADVTKPGQEQTPKFKVIVTARTN